MYPVVLDVCPLTIHICVHWLYTYVSIGLTCMLLCTYVSIGPYSYSVLTSPTDDPVLALLEVGARGVVLV